MSRGFDGGNRGNLNHTRKSCMREGLSGANPRGLTNLRRIHFEATSY
jgi:hypothetical protein